MSQIRISWIDTAKGIGILLVILFHMPKIELWANSVSGGTIVTSYMIFFFIMSGLFYRPFNLTKRIKRLMTPYLVFYLVAILLYIIKIWLKGSQLNWEHIMAPFAGEVGGYENSPIWFLLCLSHISILCYLLMRNLRKEKYIALSWIIGVIGFLMGRYDILSEYYINVSFLVLPFYVTGFSCRSWLMSEKSIWVYIFSLLISFILFSLNPQVCNVSQNYLPIGFLHFVVVSAFFTYGLMGLSIYLDRLYIVGRFLAYCGRNSLTILCTHMFLMFIPNYVYGSTGYFSLSVILGMLGIMLLEIPIVEVINRKMGWMIGRFR